jgi:multidrug transporter EmrE-like cation transporter
MTYLYLAIAIIAEVTTTSALKASEEFTKLVPGIIVVIGYAVAFYFMTLVLRVMPRRYLCYLVRTEYRFSHYCSFYLIRSNT